MSGAVERGLFFEGGVHTLGAPASVVVVFIFGYHGNSLPMREHQLTDLREEFVEWLIDPSRQGTQKDWADAHGVTPQTLSNWKKDPVFKRDLNRRLGEYNVDSVRIQAVVEAMWDRAQNGDVKAAELYLRYIEKLQPSRPVLEDDADVSKLSDEELLAALQAATQVLRR